jgi:hypothetical protein
LLILRRTSLILITCYTVIELVQLFRWGTKLQRLQHIEQLILTEMPELELFADK